MNVRKSTWNSSVCFFSLLYRFGFHPISHFFIELCFCIKKSVWIRNFPFFLIYEIISDSSPLQALTKNVDDKQLNELHSTAKPLIETCSPIIVQQINDSVRAAEIDFKDTNRNLHNLRDKHQRALNLWQDYRDGSDAIKNWAADQMSTVNVLKPLDADAIEVISSNKRTLIYDFVPSTHIIFCFEMNNELFALFCRIKSNNNSNQSVSWCVKWEDVCVYTLNLHMMMVWCLV